MMTFSIVRSIRPALLAAAMTCLCVIARADTLAIEGLPIQPGFNVAEVQKTLNTTQAPEDMMPVNPARLNQTKMRFKDLGIGVFFDRAGVSQTIRLDAPFTGSVGGIKIGSSHAYILQTLGKPVLELTNLQVKPVGLAPILYNVDSDTRVRFDFNANDEVVTMYVSKGTVKPPVAVNAAAPGARTPQANNDLKNMLDSPAWQTYMAVISDLQPLYRHDADLKQTLSKLDTFQFSDETRKKLQDLTGNDNPLHFKTAKLKNGNTDLTVAVDALDFKDAKTGASGHMAEISSKTLFNKSLNKAHTVASLPLFHFETAKTLQFTAGNFSIVSDQQRDSSGIWIGTGDFKLGQLTMDDGASKMHVTMDELSVKTVVKPHGKSLDVGSDSSIKSINWGSDGLSQVHFAVRMTNLDAKAFAAFQEKARNLNQKGQDFTQRLIASQSMMRDFGKSMQHGSAIDIQDVSAKFHGLTGGFNGRITLDNAQDSDFDSPAALVKKLDVHVNLHIPVGWVIDTFRIFTRRTLELQNKTGKPVDDATVNIAVTTEVEKQMSELERKKWIHVEHDTILSSIDFKEGKLLINGQPTPLPNLAAGTPVKSPASNATITTDATGDTTGPADKILAPGETFVLAKGQIVNFPAPASVSTSDGNHVKIEGNKNKVNAGPGTKVEVAASATGPADNVAIAAGTEVVQADFGLFNSPGSEKPSFVPGKLVPLVPNQNYGWVMQLHTDKAVVKWKEEISLPVKPASWGPPESAGGLSISADGRSATIEKIGVPDHGAISSQWFIESGDPKGHYVLRVTVEDTPAQVFEFDVR
jgi:uncharacterized protein YdgA (DUF945 family)